MTPGKTLAEIAEWYASNQPELEKTTQPDTHLNTQINPATINQFLVSKFVTGSAGKIVPYFQSKVLQVIQELNDYGIDTLQQLDDLIPPTLKALIEENKEIITLSFTGLVRTILIIHDANRYFTRSWNRGWWWLTADMTKIFELYNIPLDKLPVNYTLFDNRYAAMPC
jgi:hypothetical protein